jgi:hypothetical protein
LHVASKDHEVVLRGWRGAGGLKKDDALSALATAIVNMAEGEDVSPAMRAEVADQIICGDVELIIRRPAQRGRPSSWGRDRSIAKYVEQKLGAHPNRRKEILDRACKLFGVTTARAIELAIQRHRQRQELDDPF